MNNQGSLSIFNEKSLNQKMKQTLRMRNASSCMIDFLCCMLFGFMISIERVVMNSGVLFDAICRIANLACDPTFKVVIPSFRAEVERLNRALNISITSTYCCQMLNPREQRSMARTL